MGLKFPQGVAKLEKKTEYFVVFFIFLTRKHHGNDPHTRVNFKLSCPVRTKLCILALHDRRRKNQSRACESEHAGLTGSILQVKTGIWNLYRKTVGLYPKAAILYKIQFFSAVFQEFDLPLLSN